MLGNWCVWQRMNIRFENARQTLAGPTLQVSAFYSSPDPPRHLVRFCFCKSMEKLTAACDKMEQYFGKGGGD